MTSATVDYFISYTGVNADWAAWINDALEDAGYRTVVQLLDFTAGGNFVTDMDTALHNAERIILVLTPTYLKSGMTKAEWTAVFSRDPDGSRRLIIPVMVEPTSVEGLLGPRTRVSLVGLDSDTARRTLLDSLQPARSRPRSRAPFPGA
ncbi:toll/interleukin-1 receptor domain-containing protein [Streptomyces scabiei]|uniref:toll/interleukin-1 receptor domain-containing protein n=1 Tax=Streptomyces scabiei TaxID=1930 RepID=UPI000765C7C2|nr:toll/interleukin-1 receptor domain-containing protein [Streptomyces scabiei]